MTTQEKQRLLRAAKAKLRATKCTCDGKHDPFWMRCLRAVAEWEHDNALAICGWPV